DVNTAFLEEHAEVLRPGDAEVPDEAFVAAALADELGLGGAARRRSAAPDAGRESSPWEQGGNWEIGGRR
ncbi:MAG TPA: hypothetical protein VJS69_13830, partial [Candidatus Krumholzibacteria bacterium]|nr:hypothetical protein [Candidatus Krumholzibacteria bacterium]